MNKISKWKIKKNSSKSTKAGRVEGEREKKIGRKTKLKSDKNEGNVREKERN